MKKNLKYIIAVILIILFTFSIVPKTFQNDTFYVIELGRQIQKTGIDWIDHYSIHPNLEYRYPHWAFDVIISKVFEVLGFNGIYIFTQIFATIFILLIFGNLLKKEVNFNLSFVCTLIVAYMMRATFVARGQIISYSLFFIEYMILENFVERPTILKTLGLFLVSCIMANVHSTAWIMMLVLLLPFIGEQIVYFYSLKGVNERLLNRYKNRLEKAKTKGLSQNEIEKLEKQVKYEEDIKERYNNEKKETKIIITKKPNIKYIWIAFLALIFGALVTPIKFTPILYFLLTSLGKSMSYISEHLPTVIANNLEFFSYTAIIVALIGFTNVKLRLSDALLILGLYIMALSSIRNIYLLFGLTACIIVKLIDNFIKSNITQENKKASKIFFIIFSIISIILSIYMFINKSDCEYIDKKSYPVSATKYIKNNLDYKNIRIYNGYDYGSYLLMEGVPVFLDSRCDLYTPEFNKGVTVFDDYMEVVQGKRTISNLMDEYELEYALVQVDSIEQVYMKEDSRYTEIYSDKYFIIYKYEAR